MIKNKRGLSEVVTAIIVILLVLAAIMVLWAFIRPFFTKGGEQFQKQQCLTLDLKIEKAETVSNDYYIYVKREQGTAENFVGVLLVFYDGDESVSITKYNSISELGLKRFKITQSNLGTGFTPDRVSVAGILRTESEQEFICTESAKKQFEAGTVTCTPDCTDKVCGDDGCGGSCPPGCDTEETCYNGQCYTSCTVETETDDCTESTRPICHSTEEICVECETDADCDDESDETIDTCNTDDFNCEYI